MKEIRKICVQYNSMRAIAILLILLASARIGTLCRAGLAEDYPAEIRPLLEKTCYGCHGPEKQKGDLNLAIFDEFDKVTAAGEVWQLVLERVQAFEMPPEKSRQLSFDEHGKLLKWLRRLPKPKNDCDQLASDRTQNFYRGYVMSRRLNRAEYSNTIRDLFGLDLSFDDLLPADGGGGEGFDTTGNALFTSTIHIEKYLAAADRVLQHALPPEDHPAPGLEPRQAAETFLSNWLTRIFRRPVSDGETDRFLLLFDRAMDRGDGYLAGLRLALKGALVSPNFLFLVEPEPEEGGVHVLGGYPLASRLSYFIWSSMPDAELFASAEDGSLLTTNGYRAQIHRMLADPKAAALGERFAIQWLDLQRLGSEVRPDPSRYPEFNDDLASSMRQEVVAYFNHVIQKDRPLLELIASDYSFVDQRLAALYGLAPQEGWQKVRFSHGNRGGVTGMAAIHTLTSYPLRTSPVLRGRWILETLLGDKVPPPPPDVPALEEEGGETGKLTLREQLELHRSKTECSGCHEKMDPLGFGLENFDVLGRWRQSEHGQEIDATGTLPSGKSFTGPSGLKEVLMERQEAVIQLLARKMVGFAYGRELNKLDDCVIEHTMKALQANEYRASVLVEQIAFSYPFRHRFYPRQEKTATHTQD